MRKVIILIVILIGSLESFCQMPTDGNYSNWDWEDNSESNWRSKYGNTWVDINPPFAPGTERIGHLVDVHESGDYTKAKGWSLLWAQFDGEYPYFILYNSHKSIIRAFFYLESIPFTDVLATLSYHDINNPGLLSFSSNYQTSTEDYFNNTSTSDNDMISVVIRGISAKGWGAADFPILFDNNIKASKYANKKWKFQFFGCDNYSIYIKGTSTTDPLQQEQHTIHSGKSALTSSNFDATYAKLHKEIQSADKFLKDMQNSVKDIDTSSANFLQTYKALVVSLKDVSNVVSAVSGVSSALGAVMSFFKIINGTFAESESTKPVAVTEFIELEGSMQIRRTLGGNTLSIPGLSGTYYPYSLLWQPYNCPMGTINLMKTPKIKVTTPYERYGYGSPNTFFGYKGNVLTYIYNMHGYGVLLATGSHTCVANYPGKYKKYKFDDDIILAKQKINGLQLIDINFAIVCKPNGSGNRKYKIQDKYIASHVFYIQGSGQAVSVPAENTVYKALKEQRLIVHKFDEKNDEVYFGTPYMEKNKLRGVVIEVPEDTDVKLAVVAKFTSDKYSKPIIFKALYNLSEVSESAKTSRLFCSQEQSNFKYSEYYNTPSYINLSTANNTLNNACIIELNSGFVGNSGFIAESKSVTKGLEIGNTIINEFNYYCNPDTHLLLENPLDPLRFEEKLIFSESSRPKVSPNPTSGRIYVHSKSVIKSIHIYNTVGRICVNLINVNDTSKEVDLSDFPNGIYVVNIITTSEAFSSKVILNK